MQKDTSAFPPDTIFADASDLRGSRPSAIEVPRVLSVIVLRAGKDIFESRNNALLRYSKNIRKKVRRKKNPNM